MVCQLFVLPLTTHTPIATENYHSPCGAPVEPNAWNFPLKLGTHIQCKAYSDVLSFQCPSTLTSRTIKELIRSTSFPLSLSLLSTSWPWKWTNCWTSPLCTSECPSWTSVATTAPHWPTHPFLPSPHCCKLFQASHPMEKPFAPVQAKVNTKNNLQMLCVMHSHVVCHKNENILGMNENAVYMNDHWNESFTWEMKTNQWFNITFLMMETIWHCECHLQWCI